MRAEELISKLSAEAQDLPQIIAPVLARDGLVRVMVEKHPYQFRVHTEAPGWYILQPLSSVLAEVSREAEPYEVQRCLQSRPRLRVIAVRRLTARSWLVFPYNLSDARGRGFKAEPQQCHLIDRNLEPFTTMYARWWSGWLLFDWSSLVPAPQHYLKALETGEIEPPTLKGLNPEYRMVYQLVTGEIQKARQATVEGRIKSAVEYLGAELIGFSESGEGYSVEWRDANQVYRSRVSHNLRLLSAGICLDGLEQEQTLSSTVALMRRRDDDYD